MTRVAIVGSLLLGLGLAAVAIAKWPAIAVAATVAIAAFWCRRLEREETLDRRARLRSR
jgi:hypothetical protein